MFVNKFEIFYESQNVPHIHFMYVEGQKVHIFWKLYGLKPKSLIYYVLMRVKFESYIV